MTPTDDAIKAMEALSDCKIVSQDSLPPVITVMFRDTEGLPNLKTIRTALQLLRQQRAQEVDVDSLKLSMPDHNHPEHGSCLCSACMKAFIINRHIDHLAEQGHLSTRKMEPFDVKAVVEYVSYYGGKCRDCADEDGVCPSSGLPCADREKAIEYVVKAIHYGVKHGYISALLEADMKTAQERK